MILKNVCQSLIKNGPKSSFKISKRTFKTLFERQKCQFHVNKSSSNTFINQLKSGIRSIDPEFNYNEFLRGLNQVKFIRLHIFELLFELIWTFKRQFWPFLAQFRTVNSNFSAHRLTWSIPTSSSTFKSNSAKCL